MARLWKTTGWILPVLLLLCLPIAAAGSPEVFLVTSDSNGFSNSLTSFGEGTFGEQTYLGGPLGPDYSSYGNGIGDFDNDGDLDYVIGVADSSSDPNKIFLYENTGAGPIFAAPVKVGTWSAGYFPADMPVADFDEDGNADFVMVHYGSPDAELFAGKGDRTFRDPQVLANTCPGYSIGADSADVNNDRHADFVVASYGGERKIYVNLGNGDGTFTTSSFDMSGSDIYWGLTAADFDNDGKSDLIATATDYYDFYKGNGDGSFLWIRSVYNSNVNLQSPVDNYDFDGDGNQDFAIASLPSDANGVAIYLGNGDGTFGYKGSYSDGSGNARVALAAPPYTMTIGGNKRPTAVISPVYLEVTHGLPVIFSGAGSSDSDGTIVSYTWDFGDGTTATGETTTHAFAKTGEYKVSLTVTDNEGAKGSATATVVVTNLLPVARIEPPTQTIMGGGTASLDGSVSYDPDGSIATYSWAFGDGTYGTGSKVSHAYSDAGTYTAILTVTDDYGATALTQAFVTVTGTNKPPVAVITPATQSVGAGGSASFDGSASSDPDGSIVSYAWSFGDGATGTGPTATHRYDIVGTYSVRLTVTDDKGATATAHATVVVGAIPATVDIEPKTLNLRSQGETISATIALPAGYDTAQIDLTTVALRQGNSALIFPLNKPRYGVVATKESGVLRLKFDRQAVIDAVIWPSDPTVLVISGKVAKDGSFADFAGSASIRTISPGNSDTGATAAATTAGAGTTSSNAGNGKAKK